MKPSHFVAIDAALAGALLACGLAHADTPPSIWDIARDPEERGRWALHVRVERLIHAPSEGESQLLEGRRDEELRLEAARAMLEEADAAHSPDVRLRFDLGVVYEQLATLQGRSDLHPKVIDVLAPAVAAFPAHPGATEALDALVYAYAKLDRPRDELAAWRAYIPRLLDDRARVGPLMNMGEAQMRLGLMDDALATFRRGLRLCETLPNSSSVNATYALTLWDLAVALDRTGDPAAAIETADKANGWTWSQAFGLGPAQTARTITGWDVIRDDTDVFFIPDWERAWYLALSTAAAARAAEDPHEAAHLWGEAEGHWALYVSRSEAEGSEPGGYRARWLTIARTRRDSAKAARAAAERRAAARPPAPGKSIQGAP